jgi:aspartyl-tRNA(Asn)/glutamyl-tRNA(Gln) amidotransferase subunit A
MSVDNLAFASISEVAAGYRSRTFSPVEITEMILARIAALNPTLNAFITVIGEEALASARQAQAELHAGHDRGLLHGIPVAVKDLVDTAGIRTTCGSRILADHVPATDAQLVRHMKAAGAVLVGKTNLLEFAYGIVHPDFGPTWNPWQPTRTAGGSSGGSAAAVAAGLCYAAVGTDTGGSIRIPAAYCGVAGLKPTYDLVSLDGVFPLSWSLDHAGPITRSSADAGLLLDVLIGRQPQPAAPCDLAGLRLGILSVHRTGWEMQTPVQEAFDATCAALAHAGATLVELTIPELDLADGALFPVLGPEASAVHAEWITARAEDYAPLTRMQIELGFAVPALLHVRAQQFRRRLTGHFLKALENLDAILSPTAPWVAPHEDPPVTSPEGAAEGRRTAPYNLTGLPALTVNCGFSPDGLPIGLQIAARPGADRLVLGIGAAVEGAQAFDSSRLKSTAGA